MLSLVGDNTDDVIGDDTDDDDSLIVPTALDDEKETVFDAGDGANEGDVGGGVGVGGVGTEFAVAVVVVVVVVVEVVGIVVVVVGGAVAHISQLRVSLSAVQVVSVWRSTSVLEREFEN